MPPVRYCRACGAEIAGTFPVFTCSSCQTATYDAPVGVVLVVVFKPSGEIVMTRQAHWPPGFWGLVAGFVEEGETAEQAAIREAKEETGLDVKIEQFLGTFVDRRIPGRLMIAFSALATGGELRPGDDAADARFFDPTTAPIPLGWPAHTAIDRFLTYRGSMLADGSK